MLHNMRHFDETLKQVEYLLFKFIKTINRLYEGFLNV